jgi:hypothetical protein
MPRSRQILDLSDAGTRPAAEYNIRGIATVGSAS